MTISPATLLWKILGIPVFLVLLTGLACTDNAAETKTQPEKTAAVKQKPMASISYSKELGGGPADVWPDSALEKAFVQYWGNRFSGTPKEGFLQEAPYFQEMISENLYTRYVGNASKNKLVSAEVLGLDHEGEYLWAIKCKMLIELPNGTIEEVGVRDRWVFAGKRWYHVIQNRFFFPI